MTDTATAWPIERRAKPSTLCRVCNERPPFASLHRCKLCLQAEAEAERIKREAVRQRVAPLLQAVSAPTKVCLACDLAKPLTEFPRDAVAADGRRRACNECVASGRYVPTSKSEATRARDKKLASTPERRAANLAAVKRWQQNNRAAFLAARAVRLALKSGVLARPARCQVNGCGNQGQLAAHHANYELKLHVLWCCRSCHRKIHNGHAIDLLPGLPPELATVPSTLVSAVDEPLTITGKSVSQDGNSFRSA